MTKCFQTMYGGDVWVVDFFDDTFRDVYIVKTHIEGNKDVTVDWVTGERKFKKAVDRVIRIIEKGSVEETKFYRSPLYGLVFEINFEGGGNSIIRCGQYVL